MAAHDGRNRTSLHPGAGTLGGRSQAAVPLACGEAANELSGNRHRGRQHPSARCASIAIDPRVGLARCEVGQAGVPLFERTSDAFFAAQNPSALFGRSVDLAFIDGMHRFKFALRDVMNIEPHCRPDPLIVYTIACRSTQIWRAATRTIPARGPATPGRRRWILQRYQPDLGIFVFDASLSGLVVRHLDLISMQLRQRYDDALAAAVLHSCILLEGATAA